MERPNKNDYLTTNQIEYNQLLCKYYDALEAYIDVLEKQLTLTDVVASVLCVNSNYILGITKDVEYPLIKECDDFYIIINDLGYRGGYLKEDFVKSTMK
jgi:hypothetical protein